MLSAYQGLADVPARGAQTNTPVVQGEATPVLLSPDRDPILPR